MKLIASFKAKAFRTISVPDDLSGITTRHDARETEPEQVQLTREGVNAIWSCVEALYRTGIYPGIALTLRRKGQVVIHRAIGHSHGNGPPAKKTDPLDAEKILMTPDTPVCQYSASKAVTAMMIHWLAEHRMLSLNDPVKKFIPEFAAEQKHEITLHHLISHHGGIPVPPAGEDPEILYDHDAFVKLICRLKPTALNGGSMAYHAITGGTILGEIVRRVTGADIRELLRQTVQEPMGFRYFNYGAEDADIKKVAVNYDTGPPLMFPFSTLARRALSVSWGDVVRISNEPRFMQVILPAANLVATADEMSRFFQMLLDGGEVNGQRIFARSTIRRAVLPAANMAFDGTLVVPMRYSAGMMLGASPVGMWGPYCSSAYGHVGFINIFCWADPAREIAVSLQTTGKSLIGPHITALVRFLFTVGRHCRLVHDPDRDMGTFGAFKRPFQKMLQKIVLG